MAVMHLTEHDSKAKDSVVATDSSVTAGAPAVFVSSKETDSLSLGFDFDYVSPDLISHGLEDNCGVGSLSPLDIAKSYVNHEISLVFRIRPYEGSGVFDLVFKAIPFDILSNNCVGSIKSANFHVRHCPSYEGYKAVFTCITQLVEGVESVIPSFVSFERPQKRLDFLSQVFASTPHTVFKIADGVAEWKCRVPRLHSAHVKAESGVSRVVKGRAKMFDNLGCQNAPFYGQPLSELDFVNLVRPIRVRLTDVSAWVIFEKSDGIFREISQMLICATDA